MLPGVFLEPQGNFEGTRWGVYQHHFWLKPGNVITNGLELEQITGKTTDISKIPVHQ